jgi:hypothetical protein
MIYSQFGDVRLCLSIPAMTKLLQVIATWKAMHTQGIPWGDMSLDIELDNFQSALECEIVREAGETMNQFLELMKEYETIWIPQSLQSQQSAPLNPPSQA